MMTLPSINNVDDDTEGYFYNLVQASPAGEDNILQKVENGIWYQALLISTTTLLTPEEKALLLSTDHVGWAKLSTNILLAISIHRAINFNNKAPHANKLTTIKLKLFDEFQASCYPELWKPMPRKNRWRSALRALAIFCSAS